MARKLEFNLIKRANLRTDFSLFKFPSGGKQRFSGIRSPFGGGGGLSSGFASADFKTPFLKFMSEAGERLGKAAAEEIEKVNLNINGGNAQQTGTPVAGKPANQPQTPGQQYGANGIRGMMPNGQDIAMAASFVWAVGLRAAQFVANAPAMATDIVESQRRFAAVSPAMAGVFAESGVRGVQRDIVSGEKLAPTNRQLLQQLDKFRNSAAQVSDKLTEIKNLIGTEVLGAINNVTGPLIEFMFGKRQAPEGLPFLQKFRDMQGDDRGRRENRLAHAAKAAPPGWGVHQDPNTGVVNFIPPADFIGPPPIPWGPQP